MNIHEAPGAPMKIIAPSLNALIDLELQTKAAMVMIGEHPCEGEAEMRQEAHRTELLTELPQMLIDKLDLGTTGPVRFQLKGRDFIAPDAFLHNSGKPSMLSMNEYRTTDFAMDEALFLRKVIPVSNSRHSHFHFMLEPTIYNYERGWSCSLNRIELPGITIDLYLHKHMNRRYLIMDASASCIVNDFDEACHSILVTLAYVTGVFYQDQIFTFSYSASTMQDPEQVRCTSFRNTLESSYKPIYANAYAYLRRKRDAADQIHAQLRALTNDEFSALSSRAHSSSAFKAALMRIVEAMSSSLVLLPSGLYVALEAITKLDMGGEAAKPTIPKAMRCEIMKALTATLASFEHSVTTGEFKSMNGQLSKVSMVTSKERLAKPFTRIGADLNEEDMKALVRRNVFLHGGDQANDTDDRKADLDAFYWGLRAYTLLAILILKPLGFNARIVNYPKIYQTTHGHPVEEDYFRQI